MILLLVAPMKHVKLLADASSQLVEKTNNLQQQMVAIWLKEQDKPKAMLENITQVVAKGDSIRSSLHKNIGKYNQMFTIVNDWVGLLER
jgi:uncharacterized protein Yka (UPF0111/DUF47 family)